MMFDNGYDYWYQVYAFQANNICITKTVPIWTFPSAAFEMQHESV